MKRRPPVSPLPRSHRPPFPPPFRWIFCLLCFLSLSAPALSAPALSADVERLTFSENAVTVDVNQGAVLRAIPAVDSEFISIHWTVADEGIARLSATEGRSVTVTGVSPGVTSVSARVGSGQSVSCPVTVSGIAISPAAVRLNREETGALALRCYGNAANISNWTWRSGSPNTVRVEAAEGGAVVSAAGTGGAVITCTGGAYRAVCTVTVSAWFSTPLVNGYLRQNGGRMSLSWWSPYSNEISSLLCGVYGASGKLLAIQSVNTRAPADSGGVRGAIIPWDGGEAESVKLFAVGPDGMPLSPARALEPPAADTSAPAFSAGYPSLLSNSFDSASDDPRRCLVRFSACAGKDCVLYWALYRAGNGAPTAAAFRTGALSGSLRHGETALARNDPAALEIGALAEKTEYDIFFWLSNADFSAGSYISRVRFTTVDCTLPVFLSRPSLSGSLLNAVDISYTLSEDATLYWAAVPAGTEFPRPPTGGGAVTAKETARQIIAGIGAASYSAVTSRGNTPSTFRADGLRPQAAYDIWYVARDGAGNDSVLTNADGSRAMLTVRTQDNVRPTAAQEFTHYAGEDKQAPYADTDIRIVFSEAVRRYSTGESLADLYGAVAGAASGAEAAAAKEAFAAALRDTIRLYPVSSTDPAAIASNPVIERDAANENDPNSGWVIDYRNAAAALENGATVVTFPTVPADSAAGSALRLHSGQSYAFRLSDLSDISENLNQIAANTTLPVFTTRPARAELKTLLLRADSYPAGLGFVDMAFSVTPSATAQADPNQSWDLLFWPDVSCSYEVYIRSRAAGSADYSDDPWRKAANPNGGGGTAFAMLPASGDAPGQSLCFDLYNLREGELPALTRLRQDRVYEFAIRFLTLNGVAERTQWSREVHMRAAVVSGTFTALGNLSVRLTESAFRAALEAGDVADLSDPANLSFRMTRAFTDMAVPAFLYGRPTFRPEDVSVEMDFLLDRPGTVYYLLAPVDSRIPTQDMDGQEVDWFRYTQVPESGAEDPFPLAAPLPQSVISPNLHPEGVAYGSAAVGASAARVTVRGLLPDCGYFAYLVVQGNGNVWSPQALLYRFQTTETVPPALEASINNPAVTITASKDVVLDYALVSYESMGSLFSRPFWNNTPSGNQYAPSAFPMYSSVQTVLRAMRDRVDQWDGNGVGTIFDRYASEAYRRAVADYIRGASGDSASVVATGRQELRTDQPWTLDVSEAMKPRTRYALLAVGKSGEAGEAFIAAWPMTVPDTTPPVIVNVQNSLRADDFSGGGTFSGSVTLTFDEYLYDKDSGGAPPVLRQVDLGPRHSVWRSDEFTGVGAMVQNSTSNTVWVSDEDENNVNAPADYIILQYSQAQSGTWITFKTDLCDADGNVRRVPLTVTVEMGADNRPNVTITSAWDGRSG